MAISKDHGPADGFGLGPRVPSTGPVLCSLSTAWNKWSGREERHRQNRPRGHPAGHCHASPRRPACAVGPVDRTADPHRVGRWLVGLGFRGRFTCSHPVLSLSWLLSPRGGCDRSRTYATTTTRFPSFWQRLVGRTASWVAAMQLASLGLARADDPASLIGAFEGMQRHVPDCLADEVVGRMDEELRAFLSGRRSRIGSARNSVSD